ncbi:MAG: sigma-70 family RNA polymerase sigma factor [Chloroflexota bacterium]|nr:sigma-70 family RNA polymerase sigma factor [Chloroflexota bacterium]
MKDNEATWLTQARSGDDEAFAKIVTDYQKRVFSLCYRMLGNYNDAEDAAQESFLRAYKYLSRYDPNRSFATWLLSIASHHCIDRLRKKRLPIFSMDNEKHDWWKPPDPGLNPEADLVKRQKQERVQMMLDVLKPKDRAAVILHYWKGYSYEEISETLSLSESAIKSRLYRARRSLAEEWQKQEAQMQPLDPINLERTPHETPAF